ncbi:MAG: hypothetical protein LBQ48_07755 [Oscillospiraceae bacterium]|nr:hypothetical protein [Oscillospiraceae bacterium]
MYSALSDLYIGLRDGSELLPGGEYVNEKPVVFYGSSITQGGFASRPGNAYPAILSRRLNMDFINLGFSENAKGEIEIAEYMAGLPMTAFISDYDHNAPDIAHLKLTHLRLYEIIRKQNPELPYLILSKPDVDISPKDARLRREIVYDTYKRAAESGDRNVYFIGGERLFGGAGRDCCTIDGCHPNDLGFYRMADVIGEVISAVLL